jgi:hypothetical protein
MNLPLLDTTTLLKEIETDGHSPMKFLCNDGNVYYCKYRSGKSYKDKEIDCLAYEIVCTHLLKKLEIPTPEIALVKLTEGSFDSKDLKANKRYAKPNIICFGSKEVKYANLVTGVEIIEGKRDFNQFANPLDLLKIAIFDIWVDNNDRGRNNNYNLLLAPHSFGSRFIAFDHAFCFGGLNGLRIFNETWAPTDYQKLITTQYFKSFREYFNKKEVVEIVDKLLSLQHNELEFTISAAFAQIPQQWEVDAQLSVKILRYLTNESRMKTTRQVVLSHFLQHK